MRSAKLTAVACGARELPLPGQPAWKLPRLCVSLSQAHPGAGRQGCAASVPALTPRRDRRSRRSWEPLMIPGSRRHLLFPWHWNEPPVHAWCALKYPPGSSVLTDWAGAGGQSVGWAGLQLMLKSVVFSNPAGAQTAALQQAGGRGLSQKMHFHWIRPDGPIQRYCFSKKNSDIVASTNN